MRATASGARVVTPASVTSTACVGTNTGGSGSPPPGSGGGPPPKNWPTSTWTLDDAGNGGPTDSLAVTSHNNGAACAGAALTARPTPRHTIRQAADAVERFV